MDIYVGLKTVSRPWFISHSKWMTFSEYLYQKSVCQSHIRNIKTVVQPDETLYRQDVNHILTHLIGSFKIPHCSILEILVCRSRYSIRRNFRHFRPRKQGII